MTIFADAPHCAFPMALTLASGRHLVTYRAGSRHNVDLDGRTLVRHSDDDGATWSDARDMRSCIGDNRSAVMAEHGGAVVAGIYVRPQAEIVGTYSESRISHDGGVTWGHPRVMSFGHTAWSIVTGLVSIGGKLLAAAYGSDGGSQYVRTATSTDGLTWTPGVVVASGDGNWQEPALVDTPHGLACFLRYENGTARRIYVAWSHDDGNTWSQPQLIGNAMGGRPAPYVTPDGRIALTFRDHLNGQACGLVVSSDRETWTHYGNWSGSSLKYVYAAWMTRADGSPLIAYALQSSEYAAAMHVQPIALPAPPLPPEPQPVAITVPAASPFPVTVERDGATYRGEATATVEGDALSIGIIASAHVPFVTYEAAVLADSPLIYCKLDDSSGDATDSSGNSRDLSVLTGTGLTYGASGAVNDAIGFDGTGRFSTSFSSWMNVGNNVTVELWAKRNGSPATSQYLASVWHQTAPSQCQWLLFIDTNGKAQVGIRLGDESYTGITSTTSIDDNAWHHVAFTFDTSQDLRLYVDGSQEGGTSSTGKNILQQTSSGLRLGSAWSEGALDRYDGALDEFAWYGTALSSARIAAHFNAA